MYILLFTLTLKLTILKYEKKNLRDVWHKVDFCIEKLIFYTKNQEMRKNVKIGILKWKKEIKNLCFPCFVRRLYKTEEQ